MLCQHGDQPPTDEVNGSGVKMSSDDVQLAADVTDAIYSAVPRDLINAVLDCAGSESVQVLCLGRLSHSLAF
jgi:hypothetical protein